MNFRKFKNYFAFLPAVFSVLKINPVFGAALQEVSGKNTLIGIPGDGRPLTIKTYPAIENYQSTVYEVYGEPYSFDIRPQVAVAVLTSEEEGDVKGEVVFFQKHPPAGPIFIRGNITGLSTGKHGLHIHQAGDLREGCEKLGGHFNPYFDSATIQGVRITKFQVAISRKQLTLEEGWFIQKLHHGGPRSPVRHVGDLGNIDAKDNGVAEIVSIDPLMSLSGGPRGVVGRALVVTENEDDLGFGRNANSLVDGNSGRPVACGIIAYIR